MKLLGRKVLILLVVSVGAAGLTLILRSIGVDSVVVFLVSAVALAALAALVGEGTDQLGHRLGPGATGVLQSALGNLPELFISHLRAAGRAGASWCRRRWWARSWRTACWCWGWRSWWAG